MQHEHGQYRISKYFDSKENFVPFDSDSHWEWFTVNEIGLVRFRCDSQKKVLQMCQNIWSSEHIPSNQFYIFWMN